ncbi:MAG: ethanolamine ammonia-lyase subunit EutB [Gemmataceae bacterium]|nr:ethanolamine ammonia-lyase subunit EutB [Gemmataceae bacterium]
MAFSQTIRAETFTFASLRELLGRAGEPKSGDLLAGVGARSERERIAAKMALADVPLQQFLQEPIVDPDQDDVTRLIFDNHDPKAFQNFKSMTVGALREWMLARLYLENPFQQLSGALIPEMASALAKVLSNKELVALAAKIHNRAFCRNTTGEPGTLGVRLQPNHPTDGLGGILASTLDGLLYGAGDAVIGVNPAVDSVESVSRILNSVDRIITQLRLPTQGCCLAHVTTQLQAMKAGAPVDLLFQSIGGTQKTNQSFGVSLSLLKEAREQTLEHHSSRDVDWVGKQVMYFETGQGSSLSANAHEGVDQGTLEARAYGVAKSLDPFLVNSVVGFIGPEYLYDERQIIRAGLEDHFLGKLLGLPMGVDICFTNHAEADHNSLDNLLILLGQAGVNYIMGVPQGDDVMLNYQTTSYQDAALARSMMGLHAAPEFQVWLEEQGICQGAKLLPVDPSQFLRRAQPLLEGLHE